MANILLFQESNELSIVRQALEPVHCLTFTASESDALAILKQQHFDMIISAVYLERGNIFDFLRKVKQDSIAAQTPFVCFAARRTRAARFLNHTLAISAVKFGAVAFLQLDDFCKGDICDLSAIRQAIEQVLSRTCAGK
jgi:CheY-like chemotaxis protein